MKITSVQLVGVYLTIFVREELIRKGSIRERPMFSGEVTGLDFLWDSGRSYERKVRE